MNRFMATFGVQYKTEKHPSGWNVDPDGYVLILAEEYDEAVAMMQRQYGREYAFIYPEEDFQFDHHPNGATDVIVGKAPHPEPAGCLARASFVKSNPKNNEFYLAQYEADPWWPVLKECHEKLSALVPGYNIAQIKSKFGGLRYYIDKGNVSDEDWKAHFEEAFQITLDAEDAVWALEEKRAKA